MIGLPPQVQTLLGGQGAAGLFALLGGNAGSSSTSFGALMAQLNMAEGPQGLSALSSSDAMARLMAGGLALPADPATPGNNASSIVPADLLAALGKMQSSLTAFSSLDAGLEKGDAAEMLAFNMAGEDLNDPSAMIPQLLSALMTIMPQQNTGLPTALDAPQHTLINGAGEATTGAINDLPAMLLAGSDAAVDAGGLETPDAQPQSPSPVNPPLKAAAATADAVRAAHDLGVTGIELARIAGGRALAKGLEPATEMVNFDSLAASTDVDASDLSADTLVRAGAVLKSAHHGAAVLAEHAAGSAAASAELTMSPFAKPETNSNAALRALALGDGNSLLGDTRDTADISLKIGSATDTPMTPGSFLSHLTARGTAAINLSAPLATHVATQIAVHIGHALRDGQNEFKIRLDPPELGRIDVKLEMHQDGRVSAILAADNEQTLQLFERHHGQLERALQEAGLKADAGSLSFTLSGGGKEAKSDLNAQYDGDTDKPVAETEGASDDIIAVARLSDRALDIRV